MKAENLNSLTEAMEATERLAQAEALKPDLTVVSCLAGR